MLTTVGTGGHEKLRKSYEWCSRLSGWSPSVGDTSIEVFGENGSNWVTNPADLANKRKYPRKFPETMRAR